MANLAIIKPAIDGLPKRPVGILIGNSPEARAQRAIDIAPGSLVGLWGNYEAGGIQATDRSGNDLNGSHTGVDLSRLGPDGFHSCGEYDGATRYSNLLTARISSLYSGNELTIMQWFRAVPATWAGATLRTICTFHVSTAHRVILYKSAANTLRMLYVAAGTYQASAQVTLTDDRWHWVAMTRSLSRRSASFILDGVERAVTETGSPVAWTGTLARAYLGTTDAASSFWLGQIELTAVYNRVLGLSEQMYIARGV